MPPRTRTGKRSRRAAKSGTRPAASRRTPPQPSPELAAAIDSISEARGSRPTTLRDVRAALLERGVTWSKEGELLFPQDRTALVIEVDELIEAHGARAGVLRLLVARRGGRKAGGGPSA